MAINLRGSASIPDGSITEAKLANNAVTSLKLADSAVIESKVASDAITALKIADNAVVTSKINADAVTVDKVSTDIATQHFFGTEVELVHDTDVLTTIAEFNFTTGTDTTENWKAIGWSARAKTSDVLNDGAIHIFIDGTEYSSQTTNSLTYENLADDGVDISALSAGSHLVEVKLQNSLTATTVTIGQLDVYFSKK